MYEYYESSIGIEITAKRAEMEVTRHDCEWADFVAENGLKETYLAHEVLQWLGY